jgi:hypothetical protein
MPVRRLLNVAYAWLDERGARDVIAGLDDPLPQEAATPAERKRLEALAIARSTGAVAGQRTLAQAMMRPRPPQPGRRPSSQRPPRPPKGRA